MIALRKLAVLALLVVFALALSDSAYGVIRHNGADDQGYIDLGNEYPSTVFFGCYVGEQAYLTASGVVIDPHWAICSAHQVLSDDSDPTSFYDGYLIGTGPSAFSEPGSVYEPTGVFVHPESAGWAVSPDLALLYFEDPILDVTPATISWEAPRSCFRFSVIDSTASC